MDPTIVSDDQRRFVASEDGVLLVAHSSGSYFEEAATLCRSIRTVDPRVNVALATDLDITPSKLASAGFCDVVRADFSACRGVAFKVRLFDLTPFAGRTLFIDTDSICFGSLANVFEAYPDTPFVTLGRHVDTCHWFHDPEAIKRQYHLDGFPFFIGDFYLFDRSSTARDVFAAARRIAESHDAYGIVSIGPGPNEEPCFALAMVEHGLAAMPGRGRWIAHLPDPSFVAEHVDFSRRVARIRFEGVEQECAVLHFAAFRTQPIYYREKFRVDTGWRPSVVSDLCAEAAGQIGSCWDRTRRRVLRRGRGPRSSMRTDRITTAKS